MAFGDDFHYNEQLRGVIPDARDGGRHRASENGTAPDGRIDDGSAANPPVGSNEDTVEYTGGDHAESGMGTVGIIGALMVLSTLLYAAFQLWDAIYGL